jgi:hypothetical protein
MTPVVLAQLLMSRGHYSISISITKNKNIIEINTYVYTYQDSVLLTNSINNLQPVLAKSLGVVLQYIKNVKEEKVKNNFTFVLVDLWGKNHSQFSNLVKPHKHESMLYRLGL